MAGLRPDNEARVVWADSIRRTPCVVFLHGFSASRREGDPVVSVDAMLDFMATIRTPEEKRWAVPFAEVGSHVITCDLQCKDIESVCAQTFAFAEEVLGLLPGE